VQLEVEFDRVEYQHMTPLGRVQALREAFFHHQDSLLQVWNQQRKLRFGYALLGCALLCFIVTIDSVPPTHRMLALAAIAVLMFCDAIYIIVTRNSLYAAKTARQIAWDRYKNSGEAVF
jgi:hypothetical protein